MQKILSSLRRPSVPFQVLSDLHLEIGNQYQSFRIPALAPYLILAGDIGCLVDEGYAEFLHRHTSQFEAIFLVLGNHEFYGISRDQGLQKAKDVVGQERMKGKIILLDQTGDGVYEIPNFDVTITGCTLWSHVPDSKKDAIKSGINDFRRISEWTVEAHNLAHTSDLGWLCDQVKSIHQNNPTKAIIVVTHHAPCMEKASRPEYVNNLWNSAFATEVIRSTEWPGVKVWVYGHTHFSNDFKINGIRVIGNQRGYVFQPDEVNGRESEGFDIQKIVRV